MNEKPDPKKGIAVEMRGDPIRRNRWKLNAWLSRH